MKYDRNKDVFINKSTSSSNCRIHMAIFIARQDMPQLLLQGIKNLGGDPQILVNSR